MVRRVRMIVIGLGRMGHHHLRVLRETPGMEVVGVVDRSEGQARSLEELAVDFDAAVIATPTATHDTLAQALIARGKHVFVEKPIADDLARGEAIANAAASAGIRLAVAHVERFNPAVRAMRAALSSIGELQSFESMRVGPTDDPVLDLAVHDLDLLRVVAGPVRLERIEGTTLSLISRAGVRATIRVASGTTRDRHLDLVGTNGRLHVDYVAQSCTLNGEPLAFEPLEPLRAQAIALHAFFTSGAPGDLCLPADALAALSLATREPSAAFV